MTLPRMGSGILPALDFVVSSVERWEGLREGVYFHFLYADYRRMRYINPHSSPCPPPEGDKGGGGCKLVLMKMGNNHGKDTTP